MGIARDDGIGGALESSFQDPVVGRIVLDHTNAFSRTNDEPGLHDLRYRLLYSEGFPIEFLRQDPGKLREQRWRGDEFDPLFESQAVDVLRSPAGKVERRDQDVGIEDDSQPRRSSWISRSTSFSDLMPSRLARAAP